MKHLQLILCLTLLSLPLVGMEKQSSNGTNSDAYYNTRCKLFQSTVENLVTGKKITDEQAYFFQTVSPDQLKSMITRWQYIPVLQNYFPAEITQHITQFLIALDHGSAQNFCQNLIEKNIQDTEVKIKDWPLPATIQESFDKKYYVSASLGKISVYDHKTKNTILEIEQKNGIYILFVTKNLLLRIDDKNFSITNLETGNSYLLTDQIPYAALKPGTTAQSNDEHSIAVAYDGQIIMWNISDLEKITQHIYYHPGIEQIAFSPDNTLFASSSSHNNSTAVWFW
jgi:WD40 repeat protein